MEILDKDTKQHLRDRLSDVRRLIAYCNNAWKPTTILGWPKRFLNYTLSLLFEDWLATIILVIICMAVLVVFI